jgi:site-specific recombinase XerD
MNNINSVAESDLEQEDETSSYFKDLADLELENNNEESNLPKVLSKNRSKRILKGRIEMQLEKIREKKEFDYLYDDWS